MNVVCVTNMYPTTAEPGLGVFVQGLVASLRRLGAHVAVVPFDGRSDKRAYARAARVVRRIVREHRVDVVHAHYGLTGLVALSQRQAPVVTTFHGSEVGYVRWQVPISWVVARRCQVPVFVNADAAHRLGLPDAPVICAGVDTDMFSPVERAQARRALGWDAGRTYVLFPGGRDSLVKRADLFDAAVARAQRHRPDLVPVVLAGHRRADVPAVMNAVDVTLMTSDSDGAPVTIKESLACATPVVSVPVGDVPTVLMGLPGCTIAPRDPEALAHGVLAALEADRAPALRARAEEFSEGRMAQRTLALYEAVVGGRAA
jgi:teichuronic acid biosynthesis glycosyltransferase TuaC